MSLSSRFHFNLQSDQNKHYLILQCCLFMKWNDIRASVETKGKTAFRTWEENACPLEQVDAQLDAH